MNRFHIDKGITLYKRYDSPTWYLDINIAGRPRQRISMKTAVKEKALPLARQLAQEALSKSWGIPLPTEKGFEEFLTEKYKPYAEAHNAPLTVELNLANLQRLREFVERRLKLQRPIRLSDITPELIDEYKAARKFHERGGIKKETSPATINRELDTFSAFFNLAKEKNLIRSNPLEHVRDLPAVRRVPKTLTSEQIASLLEKAAEPVPLVGRNRKGKGNTRPRITPLYDMVVFALNTGARLGELLYLEWADVDLADGLISFRSKPEHRLKDRNERQVKANQFVQKMLEAREEQSESKWVFPNSNGEPNRRDNALRELKRVAAAAEVPWANFQILRRTFATTCAKNGIPAFVLKELLGHSSVTTTEGYYVGVVGGVEWKPPVVGG